MMHVLFVGIGGFIGSISRYFIQESMQRIGNGMFFPVGTLAVNVIGCLAIGYLGGWEESKGMFSTDARLFLYVGVLGGFTTYSAYGFETMKLFRDGETGLAFMNIALHLIFGLGSVWVGFFLARR